MAIFLFLITAAGYAQSGYWQQKVQYVMDVSLDVGSNKLSGKQKITYFNNSPDKLKRVFIHLYWNAFQPNSMMDARSRELGSKPVMGRPDWDPRVKDRILNLKPEEIGYQKIVSLKMNGIPQKFIYHETILEVQLSSAIAPGSKVIFDVVFEAQVPLQVRRSGRDNPNTGVRYSMSQWYPKICEYDVRGWHPTPYVAREFYGVWGDFDVNISLDKSYKLGATGVLSNAKDIGWGYDTAGTALKNISSSMRTWKFSAKNVHDFVWAADPDYRHIVRRMSAAGPFIHVIYKPKATDTNPDSAWLNLADAAVKVLPFMEKNFGKYPYPQYSFIHGGDGGMEYPMATLVAGPSLGTAFHEWMHSWYQMMMGTDEGSYPWMDEGFTDYAEDAVMKFYQNRPSILDMRNSLKANPTNENLKRIIDMLPDDHAGSYASYFQLAASDYEEPMTTHSDHYESNFGYSINSYSKGCLFLSQLGYVTGDSVLKKIMLAYYDRWKFKHPSPQDFVKTAQDISGLQLAWYLEYWTATTKKIDYAIDSLWEAEGKTKIRIRRLGSMPMPIDVQCSFRDSSSEMHHVPLDLCFGNKGNENPGQPRFVHDEWHWTHPVYVVDINRRLSDLKKVEIDPSKRMADVNRKNNKLELEW
jgi:hypothetical protein